MANKCGQTYIAASYIYIYTFICMFGIYLFGLLTEVSYLGAPFWCIYKSICVFLGPLLTLFSFSFDLGLNIFRRPVTWVFMCRRSILAYFYDYYVERMYTILCSPLFYLFSL